MAGGVELVVHVSPRASRSGIDGVDGQGRLRVRVTAPPVEGAANDAVTALLAVELGVRRSSVSVVSGLKARDKRVRVDGLERSDFLARWPALRFAHQGAS